MIIASRFRSILCAVAVLLLTGCAAVPVAVGPTLDWDARVKMLSSVRDWHATGRVAMQTEDDSWSASIDWSQVSDDYVIRLSGPLGSHAMTINGGPGYAVMETGDGERYIESSAGRLIEAHTGWQIPVEGLKYWALALVEPGQPSKREFDDQGRLFKVYQSGWKIHYQDYLVKDNLEMPRKIQLDNEHFRVKLVIRDWQLGGAKS